MALIDPWPLRRLVLRTPRLELRPDDDAGLYELAALARAGVHPADSTPFVSAWTDVPADEIGPVLLRRHWSARAALSPASWHLNLLVRLGGVVIGVQSLGAERFGVRRECETGSWLGLRHQGHGFGTEMRAAVAAFAFEYLDAASVRSGALSDNAASLAVSRKLGYVTDGTATHSPRGEPRTEIRLLLDRKRFARNRPHWTLETEGVPDVLSMLDA